MFNFHKPKTYRSSQGCCICRAKSSSSRFTDSKRYEWDFPKCFRVENRQGEICNACVLLVKRWKKLPLGSKRDWQHVVDARAGPGNKSMMKIRAEVEIPKKHKHRYQKKIKITRMHTRHSIMNSEKLDDGVKSEQSKRGSPIPSLSEGSDDSMDGFESDVSGRRRKITPTKNKRYSSFLDMAIWKKAKVCCGTIFKGPSGEVLIDPRFIRPCNGCRRNRKQNSVEVDELPRSPLYTAPSPPPPDLESRDSGAEMESSHSSDATDFAHALTDRTIQPHPPYLGTPFTDQTLDIKPENQSIFTSIAISMEA
ncbi:unnamed protein product [Owenia fusiformis]|uniref:Uncharacterized protein n=1 Tax=Owenia fusiformis TaxID=6347 RepID=A0A8J1TA19_OWEFU|nr:unnamed protein product [Owenia fusiformis]